MAQRSFKLPDELDAKLAELAARDDRSVSYVIVRALEQALGSSKGSDRPEDSKLARTAGSPEAGGPSVVSAPARTSEGTPVPKIAPRHWSR